MLSRYMHVLAKYSEMQTQVEQFKRQLGQQNYGAVIVNDVPSEAHGLQSKQKSFEMQSDARERQRLRELVAKSELTTTKAKRELTALNKDLKYLASLASSAYTNAYREHLMKSGAVVDVNTLQGADHTFEKSDGNHFVWGVKKTQADRKTILSLGIKLWFLNAFILCVVPHLHVTKVEREIVCLKEVEGEYLGTSHI